MSSEHEVRVVRLQDIVAHPNADTLSITEVDGRPCVVKSGLWSPGDLAVYIPIDSMVDLENPLFSWLKPGTTGRYRVRATKLRGVFSMGILVRPDPAWVEGAEVSVPLGISVYEGPEIFSAGDQEGDPGFLPVYDLESFRRNKHAFKIGEEVVLTEKVHGANARFAFHEDRMWCASRTTFKKPDSGSMWWEVAQRIQLPDALSKIPGFAVYGEVYGNVQDLKYNTSLGLVVFDVLDIRRREWLQYEDQLAFVREVAKTAPDVRCVPELWRGSFPGFDSLVDFAERPSKLAAANGIPQISEGFVIRAVREHEIGTRRVFKLHGQAFLSRKGG